MRRRNSAALSAALFAIVLATTAAATGLGQLATNFTLYEWDLENAEAMWDPRAGLQVVAIDGNFYLMGGRTPIDPAQIPVPGASVIHGDVWQSGDEGQSWTKILDTETEGHWPPRAYFQALERDGEIFVLGGQDFSIIDNPDPEGDPLIPFSNFFSDVWSSTDAVNWTQLTEDAGWEGRAGLSAVVYKDELYVLGGSVNDDDAIGGPGGPPRIYFNDVWKSADGVTWTEVTDAAPWAPRAGAIVIVHDNYIYLLGGEEGFLCEPFPFCEPPYFNDVWRSQDGENWELVNEDADWEKRPGHQAVSINKHIVLFGGFGLGDDISDPFAPGNPMDVWVSRDGTDWYQVSDSPWNAVEPSEIKYDFDALVVPGGRDGIESAVFTFGGDRETFDFTDPLNYLNVDNDVWRYSLPSRYWLVDAPPAGFRLAVAPNPFNPATEISFELPESQHVRLAIYDVAGRHVRTLVDRNVAEGRQSFRWDGNDQAGSRAASGVYLAQVRSGDDVESVRLLLTK